MWTTIRDKHGDASLDGPQWKAVHDELLPKMRTAESLGDARDVLRQMIARLHLTHYNIIPGDVYSDIQETAAKPVDVDVRVIGGKPVAVSGKNAGQEIAGMEEVVKRVDSQYKDSTLRDMMLARAVKAKLSEEPAKAQEFEGHPLGEPVKFGNLPTQYFWIESKRVGDAGYVAFDIFLNPPKLFSTRPSLVKDPIEPELSIAAPAMKSVARASFAPGLPFLITPVFVKEPILPKLLTPPAPPGVPAPPSPPEIVPLFVNDVIVPEFARPEPPAPPWLERPPVPP